MAKSPYNRKEYLRHRTSRQQRIVNRGIDIALKGTTATTKALDKLSTQDSTFQENQVRIPSSITIAGIIVGLFVFLVTVKPFGAVIAFILGFVSFLVLLFTLSIAYGAKTGKQKRVAQINSNNEVKDTIAKEARYQPNSEWMGQVGLVDSRANAQILAPQFMKQALESAKILQTTTEPGTFFTRYDFCVGRLMELEECKKYGVSASTTQDLEKYRSMDFREEAVDEIIRRTQEKYQTKIESLKTQKAKQNWATKYHQAFEPYLPYMSDTAKSKLGESSAKLFALAEKKDDTAESVR